VGPVTARTQLEVFYAQYYLREADAGSGGPDRVENGLVEASGSAALVIAGLHTGTIELAVELRSDPPKPDLSLWEEAAEVSIDSPQGRLYVVPWGGGRADLPNLASAGLGPTACRFWHGGATPARRGPTCLRAEFLRLT
jgi:hypothetical protein